MARERTVKQEADRTRRVFLASIKSRERAQERVAMQRAKLAKALADLDAAHQAEDAASLAADVAAMYAEAA